MELNSELIIKEKKYIFGTYRRYPVVFVRGEGSLLWDEEGREYLDMVGGLGTAVLGHCPQVVVDAVCSQSKALIHTSNLYYTEPQIELAEKVSSISLGGACFFSNSGAEANEAAIKLARRHGKINRNGAFKIITAEKSFHGRTLATLAATGQPEKHLPFEPMLPGFIHVPFNDLAALETALDDDVCAVMLEPVQGEGGIWPADKEYLRGVRRLCDSKNVLLILDEVQTGLGRCGAPFAYQLYEIAPDLLTTAKALASGLPIGALIASPDHSHLLAAGEHATTYGGGPVICAAAIAVLDYLQDQTLWEKALEKGDRLRRGLESLASRFPDLCGEVRGLGLMLALQLKKPVAREVTERSLANGLLVNEVQADAIRFLPPLIISDAELKEGLNKLTQALKEITGGLKE